MGVGTKFAFVAPPIIRAINARSPGFAGMPVANEIQFAANNHVQNSRYCALERPAEDTRWDSPRSGQLARDVLALFLLMDANSPSTPHKHTSHLLAPRLRSPPTNFLCTELCQFTSIDWRFATAPPQHLAPTPLGPPWITSVTQYSPTPVCTQYTPHPPC